MTDQNLSKGRILVVGLGPGPEKWLTPEASDALVIASDLIGYGPYVERAPHREGQLRHASDNRVEIDRARHALELAKAGRVVAVVSGGDPGVFAMAAALFEAVDHGDETDRAVRIEILPGVSAMQGAAARLGAPLGHDFCAINLSDNLKPQALIERRLALAAEADFAIALYNPRSKARPDALDAAFALLRETCGDNRPVLFARAVSTPEEVLRIVPLPEAKGEMADMRTVVIIGSSRTRMIPHAGQPILYTPRTTP